jgi:hypothetical protein
MTPEQYVDRTPGLAGKLHRDPGGRLCITVRAGARPRKINPNLIDHLILAQNNCPQTIGIQVCYYRTQNCITMQVPGGKMKEAILGIMTAIRDFQFEYREAF